MALTDDIVAAARTASDALETHLDEDPRFGPFSQRVTPEWLRLVQARRDFRASGATGSTDLLAKAEAARDAATAMEPENASVNETLTVAGALTRGLERASGGGARASTATTAATPTSGGLRGSLRVTAATRPFDARSATVAAGASSKALPKGGATGAAAGDPSYYQKLTNLFPAEALALYGTGVALFGGATPFVVLAALGVLLLLRIFASQPTEGGPPEWIAVLVAAVSYLLWATATDPAWLAWIAAPDENLRRGAAFLGAALVVVAPLLVRTKLVPQA